MYKQACKSSEDAQVVGPNIVIHFLAELDNYKNFKKSYPDPDLKKKLGFAFFNFSRRAARDTDRMEIQKYHVGARDACASTNRHEWSETRMKNLYLRNCVFATYFWKELSTSLTI